MAQVRQGVWLLLNAGLVVHYHCRTCISIQNNIDLLVAGLIITLLINVYLSSGHRLLLFYLLYCHASTQLYRASLIGEKTPTIRQLSR
jgi:hypothetical protein